MGWLVLIAFIALIVVIGVLRREQRDPPFR